MLKRAGELAAQAPAGPVYVNTPVEVLLSQWTPRATGPAAHPGASVAASPDVETAAGLLATARRPVLAVESAGRDAASFAALAELVISVACLGNSLEDTVEVLRMLDDQRPSSREFERPGTMGFGAMRNQASPQRRNNPPGEDDIPF